jgi:hypothetical protein
VQPIYIDDPAWQMIFPHRVTPFQDEWLFGLLLRCDKVNFWGSGTTLTYWLRSTRGQCRPAMSNFAVGTSFHMGFLAQLLGLSEEVLLATTYYRELAYLYSTIQPSIRYLMVDMHPRCCPICIAQSRLMRRTFILPQITACPLHRVVLLSRCPCGGPLRSQTMLEEPFVCGSCNTGWEDFPQIPAGEDLLLFEEKHLRCYEFLLSQGTPTHLECARRLILQKAREKKVSIVRHYDQFRGTRIFYSDATNLEKLSLSFLIDVLVALDISPEDIVAAVNVGDTRD